LADATLGEAALDDAGASLSASATTGSGGAG